MFEKQVNFESYSKFVEGVTSKPSNDTETFVNRISELQENNPDINIALLATGSMGLGSEGGEIAEIVKKVLFHGKELTEETRFHLQRELGDVIWYWMNTCRALNVDPNTIIEMNVEKLEARYPGGKFDVWHSENRKEGDL
jgi:NTP pyrophosphatase (non-canonical NTP hydrolase)